MTDFIAAILLLLLAVGGVVARKTYYALPVHELKRRAAHRDPLAAKLYQAVAYGNSLRILLWVLIAGCSGGGLVLLARIAPVWLGLIAVIGLLWLAYSWLPASRVTSFGTRLAVMAAPVLAWVLSYAFPLLDRLAGFAGRLYSGNGHTGLFERSDLLALIDRQSGQADSRISSEELEIVKRALSFDDHAVADILTPAKDIKTILAGDTVGPILIDELYKQGQEVVLVRESADGPVIGMLEAKRLDLKSTGQVRDLMNQTVHYLHERDTLSEALHAFFTTNSPMFVVVNNAEEYIGVVSIQNVLQALLGHIPGDDFDQYTSLSAVAGRHLKHRTHEDPETEELITEVSL